jgi:hypothetical protein
MQLVGRLFSNLVGMAGAAFAAGSLAAPWPTGDSEPLVDVPVAPSDPAQVLVVGDSIAVGTKPYLGDMVTDREVTFDAISGRTTPQGMRALHYELRRVTPQTVVFNLGTNDGSSAGVFANRIKRTLASLELDTCVIWPTISRARRKGEYRGLNRVLRDAASHDNRLVVIPWDRMVAKGTVALPDGVHPDTYGYRYLSLVTAAAIQRGCDAQSTG